MRALFSAITIGFLSFPWQAAAWGERGHHTVCDVATRLVSEPGLREFLKMRGHVMGHTCNVPDIHWKSLPSSVSGIGGPTHYIEPDMIGLAIKDTPSIFSEFIQKLTVSGEPTQLVNKVGTLWWRAEEFFNLAHESAEKISSQALPLNGAEEQLDTLPYNEAIYEMMKNMGLMGHFIGDASMPYHNWADYDGYAVGRGGIHAYYESTCPGEFGSDLIQSVNEVAVGITNASNNLSAPELVKKLSKISVEEVAAVEKLDVVLEPSTQTVNEHGMTVKKTAVRPAPAQQCPTFRPLITLQMARSSKLLAQLWDKMYVKAGRPNLSAYKSYRYPLTPDFVKPKYLENISAQ